MSQTPHPSIDLQRRIHLTRLLGEGGMGRVYDGYAPDLDHYLAVKILREEHLHNDEVRTRFNEEIMLLGMIDHPGCPLVYGKGHNQQGLPYYAMKKIEGRSLADLIADRGQIRSMAWRHHLLWILLHACETIAVAHQRGIVHRDLKPHNILIDGNRSVFVIDWGIAKRTAATPADPTLTIPGHVMGSPGYMAPEQAEGHAATAGPPADVFALGAILYEILTGRRPFGDNGGRNEILAAVHREPKPPRHIYWCLPRTINAICMRALHKNPAKRYPDARALASDLRAFLEGRTTWLERIRESARQRPLQTVATAFMILLLLVIVGGFLTQFWTDHRMADKALARVAQLDAELVRTAADADMARRKLAAGSTDATRRRALEQELQQLDARWIVTELEILRMLSSVTELRFIHVESEVQPLARSRLLEVTRSLIEREHPALAAGLAETVLTRLRDGSNPLGLRESDLVELQHLAAEANRHISNPPGD